MARICTLKEIQRDIPIVGQVTVRFEMTTPENQVPDVQERVYPSFSALTDVLATIEDSNDTFLTSEIMALILVGKAFKSDPTLSNTSLILNHKMTIDLTGLAGALTIS